MSAVGAAVVTEEEVADTDVVVAVVEAEDTETEEADAETTEERRL